MTKKVVSRRGHCIPKTIFSEVKIVKSNFFREVNGVHCMQKMRSRYQNLRRIGD